MLPLLHSGKQRSKRGLGAGLLLRVQQGARMATLIAPPKIYNCLLLVRRLKFAIFTLLYISCVRAKWYMQLYDICVIHPLQTRYTDTLNVEHATCPWRNACAQNAAQPCQQPMRKQQPQHATAAPSCNANLQHEHRMSSSWAGAYILHSTSRIMQIDAPKP